MINKFLTVVTIIFFSSSFLCLGQLSGKFIFKVTREPNENAFSFFLPEDWTMEGGIFRIEPTAGGGSGNAIDAKLDFTMKKDQAGTVMMRWLPDMNYFDMSMSPAGQMGMYPTGSNYNGMMVLPKLTGLQFIRNVVIPYAHPELSDYEIIKEKNSPEIVEAIKKADAYFNYPFLYDAGIMSITYSEKGITYKEMIISVCMDFGELGAGMWKNRFTLLGRTPVDEFTTWEPVFQEIMYSVKINMKWLINEIQGQVQRGQVSAQVLRKLQQMENEIQQNTSKTYAEINNDMFLTLTEQEEYINPYTNKVEVGSNQWKYRWVNESGDVVYADNEDYDPNQDEGLNRADYKKSGVRKR
ncbi:MAG: hypothetical protein K9H58_14760 [Bacteroidales bacterium]|nr:hypothetical protein [Bacteroidales bacterium]